MKRWLTSSVAVLALVLAACSTSSPNASKDLPSLDSGSTVTTRSGSTTTTKPKTSTTTAAALGTLFTDPAGQYEIRINPAWTTATGEDSTWLVSGASQPKTRMAAQSLTGSTNYPSDAAVRADVESGIRSSFPDAVFIKWDVIRSGTSNGLFSIEYTGTISGTKGHFFQVLSIANGGGAVASLVSLPQDFATAYKNARPYMLTIRAL